MSESLSSVPFDVLFLFVIAPAMLRLCRPMDRCRRLFDKFWSRSVSLLCLSSLVQDGMYPVEQSAPSHSSRIFWSTVSFFIRHMLSDYNPKATYARVPNRDQLKLLPNPDRRPGTFILLDPLGTPQSREDKLRLLKQDQAAKNAGRDPEKDYAMVWLPQWWQARIYGLIFLALSFATAFLAIGFFGPILIGRLAIQYVSGKDLHDGYAYVGFAICDCELETHAQLVGAHVAGLVFITAIRASRWVGDLNRSALVRYSGPSARIKRMIMVRLTHFYALVLFYGVLPLIVGINWELYIGMLGRYGSERGVSPVLHVWDAW